MNWQSSFLLLDTWEERYSYLIALGKRLPNFSLKTLDHRVPGCVSRVWLDIHWPKAQDTPTIWLDSDALIVRGLLFMLHSVYSSIRWTHPYPSQTFSELLRQLGLEKFLTPNRVQGLLRVEEAVQKKLKTLLPPPC